LDPANAETGPSFLAGRQPTAGPVTALQKEGIQ
jgi:hypothetical protein